MTKNHNLAQSILDASWGKFLTCISYKAESACKSLVRVNPSGTSERLSLKDPYRDYISANRILIRGWGWGWGSPDSPAEKKPLLVKIPASSIIEAGSPQAYSRG